MTVDPSHSPRILVTGFLAFDRFDVNPSALLAEQAGLPYRHLEVAYQAVDDFVAELPTLLIDRLLMIGVAGTATRPRLERVARNIIGPTPDVRGVIRGPAPIDPLLPPTLPDNLWEPIVAAGLPPPVDLSTDAGSYLCNYLFYRVRSTHPDLPAGFLHVPPLEAMPLDRQRECIGSLLERL